MKKSGNKKQPAPRKTSPSPFEEGDYTGLHDKSGRRINVGDTVKITIGRPNNGYRVIFEAGAFCFTGGQVGTCSFIKFRDELLSGLITGKPITEPFESFLELVSNKPDVLMSLKIDGTGASFPVYTKKEEETKTVSLNQVPQGPKIFRLTGTGEKDDTGFTKKFYDEGGYL